MRKVMQKAASFSLVALLGILSFGVHAGAASRVSGHAMEGMNHSSSSSSCATICSSAALRKEEYVNENSEEDDKTDEPFYVHLRPSSIVMVGKEHDTQTIAALKRDPPPGLPAYLALTVFRA